MCRLLWYNGDTRLVDDNTWNHLLWCWRVANFFGKTFLWLVCEIQQVSLIGPPCPIRDTFETYVETHIYDVIRLVLSKYEKTKFLYQSGAEILTCPLLRRGCAIRDGANLFRSSSYLLCSFVITVILYSKQFFSHKCHIKYTFRGLI